MEFSAEFEKAIDAATQQLMQLLSVPGSTAQGRVTYRNISDPDVCNRFASLICEHPLVLLETVSIPRTHWVHKTILGSAFPDIKAAGEYWIQSVLAADTSASTEAQAGSCAGCPVVQESTNATALHVDLDNVVLRSMLAFCMQSAWECG